MKALGRYVLLDEVGRGSMGTVYKASDPLIERTVAIKTINATQIEDGGIEPRRRFLREARAAGRLSHPSIVTLHDVGELEDIAYIVMEFLEGRSLADILDRGEPIPFATAAAIAQQTAEAIGFAHRQGVVHRDIKPGNLMLTRDGRVKITDFGIARIDQTSKTRTGVLVGSPGYMSPEQLQGKGVDGRSDVFSLGVVLYQMLAGRAPFAAERPDDVLTLIQNIASRPHESLRKVNPDIPASLEVIVDHALKKDPAERYRNAEQMAGELKAALKIDVKPQPGDADIAALAKASDGLLPELDIFASSTATVGATTVVQPAPAAPAAPGGAGLLERLKSQAEAIESPERSDDLATSTLMRQFGVERQMRAGFTFFQELVRYIGIVKPAIGYDYTLEGLGTFPKPKVADAFVDTRARRADGRPWMDAILLTVLGVSPAPLRFERAAAEIQPVVDRLNTANLRYGCEEQLGADGAVERGIFDVAGEITVHVRIMADRDRGRVAFLCRNVGQFGTANFVFDAASVTAVTFEEFANYMLGQPNRFLQLAGTPGSA